MQTEIFENKIWTPDQELRALSLYNPYAGLMLHNKIETRPRPTNVRGWVLIASCKLWYAQEAALKISGQHQFDRITQIIADSKSNEFIDGSAIAIGNLVDCRPMETWDEDACFVQHRPGLYCWVFTDVRPMIPFKWSGKQGWAFVPQEVKDKIRII